MLETYVLPQGPAEGVPETLKPSIHVLEARDDYARVALEPLVPGFAHTIGNPLRRILLSSIKGSAITWVKIDNVVHEYTAIPGVKEEVMDLLLNIKRIRIHSQSERTGKMRLEVAGEGRICAGDIATSADFEIVNPELHLATLDSADSSLSIEFNVEPGVGYRPAIQSEGLAGLPVGVLPVDAIFNPVRKVNYIRKPTRVGQETNYDCLELELWTDGSIDPLEALGEAAGALVDDFFLFKNLSGSGDVGADRPSISMSPEMYQSPIERLGLHRRTLNCLKRAHITRVGELLEMSDDDLFKIRNFGEKSLVELREKLAQHGAGSPSQPSDPDSGLSAFAISSIDDNDYDLDLDDDEDEEVGETWAEVDSVSLLPPSDAGLLEVALEDATLENGPAMTGAVAEMSDSFTDDKEED